MRATAVYERDPQYFGRYRLHHRIGIGGMGEVFAASAEGAQGFERPVAIKVVLPELGDDPQFQQLFIEEAKISMFLQHANIVQVLDLGERDGRYFLAMEFVEGPNLSRILKLLAKQGKSLPVHLASYVLIETLKGLDYAHKARGKDGKPLSIVHRDVTPQNILLSLAGEVKLSDFGIARAAGRHQRTRTGMVRGKLYYLSPEQVTNDAPTGPWTDVYAAGMVLLTGLLGRSPLDGMQEPQVVDFLRSGVALDTQPGSMIPPGIVPIIHKALAPNYRERFQTAAEFQEALEEFLLANRIKTGARHLAEMIHALAVDEAKARGIPEPPPLDARDARTVPTPTGTGSKATTSSLAIVMGTIDEPQVAPLQSGTLAPPRAPAKKREMRGIIAVGVTALAIGAAFFGGRLVRAGAPLAPVAVEHGGERPRDATVGWLDFDPSPWAEVSIDGSPIGTSPIVGHSLTPGKHTLEFKTVDGQQGTRTFEIRAGRSTHVR